MTPVVKETRREFRERLQAEGRWAEALEYRECLQGHGATAKAAQQSTVKKYQPLDGRTTEAAEEKPAKGKKAAARVDWKKEVEWVYLNMGKEQARKAPSPGAKAMWEWAKKDPEEFFKSFVTRLLPSKTQVDADAKKPDEGGAEVLGLLDQFMEQTGHGRESQAVAGEGAAVRGNLPPNTGRDSGHEEGQHGSQQPDRGA